mmetsp:Transcript_31415/g.98510  ORF Transcript_31415/g.98510 Transcript_31415/m.98510 type:complete len:510 (+) Transcript_31415:1627-3156(+)
MNPLPAEPCEGLVHFLGSLIEEDVGRVAKAKHRKLCVLHEVCRRGLQEGLHLLPELHGGLGHVALAGRRDDGQHLGLVGKIRDGKVVEGHALGLHPAPLHLELEVLGDDLCVAGVRAVEDGHALAGDLLAHALLQVLQQVLIVHCLAAAQLVTRPGTLDHGALQQLGILWRRAPEGGEAVLVRQEVLHYLFRDALVVQLKPVGVALDLVRIVTVHGPVPALNCLRLLEDHGLVAVAMPPIHAGGIGDDDRGAVVCLRLSERLDSLVDVCGKGHRGDVRILMHHSDRAEVLLFGVVAAGSHLHNGALGRSLGDLGAGVAVTLRVQDEDVDVLAGRQHVVQAAEADVVGPAVAADDPMGRSHEHVLGAADLFQEGGGIRAILRFEEALDDRLHGTTLVSVVKCVEPFLQQACQLCRDQSRGFRGILHKLLRGELQLLAPLHRAQGHAKAVLGGVLEEGPRPGGALPVPVRPEGAQAVRTAPDGGATAAVGNDHAVSEHLRQKLHVGRLTTA